MINDELKDFVDNNRDSFDTDEPAPKLFARISKQLYVKYPQKKLVTTRIRFAAAAIIIIILTGGFYLFLIKKGSPNPVTQLTTTVTDDEAIIGDPVYAKQINNFREVIGLQQSALKQLEKEHPKLYNQFVGDLIELDSSYQVLKQNLATNPNREMLLEAMIQNLQLQNELLNKQLLIIKEIKQKNNNHEKNTI